ncbi:SMI1 / KNR4 family (SUKH-1) [Lentzea fradiae]|uniref:SMI1 / KNR4 family (SUKH-1) n=1 Tax=Lentzea fradiae TaxID=200378 RepID=A0A1G7KXV9_9PSEU|nr:SMI1/KNR4 family protein [Lentzea fradiae]SDF42087.1 SMI1 / KNR4 family (SUKH-1) [Lentzea fradiae]
MQAELAAVAHDLVAAVEPGFGHLTLRASCGGGGSTHRLTAGPSEQDVFAPLESLREVGLDRPVVFEMRVEENGTFQAVATRDIIQVASLLPPTYTILLKPPPRRERREVSTLAEVESVIGVSLPPELHDLHAGRARIDEDITLYSPDDIVLTWQSCLSTEEEDPRDWETPVLYAGPPDAVRTVRFHPRWVPFGYNDWGDALCVDLAPGPRGRAGQVVQLAGEGPLTYLADSVAGLVLPDSYPGTRGLKDSFTVADRGLEGIAALPETVQSLTLREPGDLDFGVLARLSSLRELRITRGGSVRLGALAHLPLRRLEVSGYEIELPVCETITALVLDGAFVDLPPLPNLRVLDVSKAEVDVEYLPEVDYLVMNAAQWRRCSTSPAAATLTGESSLAGALAWARERGVELPYEVVSGRVSAT